MYGLTQLLRSNIFILILILKFILPSLSFAALSNKELYDYLVNRENPITPDEKNRERKNHLEIVNNWPVVYTQLLHIIRYEDPNRYFLDSACDLLSRYVKPGEENYRDVVLIMISKIAPSDKGLNEAVLSLFQRCCTPDDIGQLLNILATNQWLHCKVDAAIGLAKVGDAAALRKMRNILEDLKAKEPARYEAQRREMERSAREVKGDPNAVITIPHWKPRHLEEIDAQMKKLEGRLNSQNKPLLHTR